MCFHRNISYVNYVFPLRVNDAYFENFHANLVSLHASLEVYANLESVHARLDLAC